MNSGVTEHGRFAFVIPVFNHAEQISQVIEGLRPYGCSIIVVNDGSTDQTAACLEKMQDIQLLVHDTNRGKGAALLTGFAAAAEIAEWAVTIDADGQHNPADAEKLMQAARENPGAIVIGRREGMKEQQAPWTSRFGRGFSNFWVYAAGGKWLSDSQTGYRVYPLPMSLRLGTASRRFQFEVEILVRALWNRIPVVQRSVRVRYKREIPRVSHFRPFVDFWRNASTFTRLIIQRVLIPPPFRRRKNVHS